MTDAASALAERIAALCASASCLGEFLVVREPAARFMVRAATPRILAWLAHFMGAAPGKPFVLDALDDAACSRALGLLSTVGYREISRWWREWAGIDLERKGGAGGIPVEMDDEETLFQRARPRTLPKRTPWRKPGRLYKRMGG